jgi:hypothetical protein
MGCNGRPSGGSADVDTAEDALGAAEDALGAAEDALGAAEDAGVPGDVGAWRGTTIQHTAMTAAPAASATNRLRWVGLSRELDTSRAYARPPLRDLTKTTRAPTRSGQNPLAAELRRWDFRLPDQVRRRRRDLAA